MHALHGVQCGECDELVFVGSAACAHPDYSPPLPGGATALPQHTCEVGGQELHLLKLFNFGRG